jgi:hypothetical protein
MIYWGIPSSGMWRHVDLVWTDVSEERFASILRVEKNLRAINQRVQVARIFFYHEDGGDMFVWNIGSHEIYTAPHS